MSRRDVLLVDDDPRFRAVAIGLLPTWGFDIAGEAANGRDALAAVRRLRPSIVLLDVQLPDLDGFQVARRLLASEPAPTPAVILISTREAIDYGRQIGDSGAVGFITKSRLSGEALRMLLAEASASER